MIYKTHTIFDDFQSAGESSLSSDSIGDRSNSPDVAASSIVSAAMPQRSAKTAPNNANVAPAKRQKRRAPAPPPAKTAPQGSDKSTGSLNPLAGGRDRYEQILCLDLYTVD